MSAHFTSSNAVELFVRILKGVTCVDHANFIEAFDESSKSESSRKRSLSGTSHRPSPTRHSIWGLLAWAKIGVHEEGDFWEITEAMRRKKLPPTHPRRGGRACGMIYPIHSRGQ